MNKVLSFNFYTPLPLKRVKYANSIEVFEDPFLVTLTYRIYLAH